MKYDRGASTKQDISSVRHQPSEVDPVAMKQLSWYFHIIFISQIIIMKSIDRSGRLYTVLHLVHLTMIVLDCRMIDTRRSLSGFPGFLSRPMFSVWLIRSAHLFDLLDVLQSHVLPLKSPVIKERSDFHMTFALMCNVLSKGLQCPPVFTYARNTDGEKRIM